jgi:hypothetical protein
MANVRSSAFQLPQRVLTALCSALPSDLAFGEHGFHPFIKPGDAVLFELHLLRLLEPGLLRNLSSPNFTVPQLDSFLRPA